MNTGGSSEKSVAEPRETGGRGAIRGRMRDREWAEAALETAGITPERVGDLEFEVAIRETLDRANGVPTASGSASMGTPSQPVSRRPSDFAPLAITPEQLRTWQERNRAHATEAELEAATRKSELEAACAVCDGARWVRDPDFRPGKASVPVLGAADGSFPGAMPCPECNSRSAAGLLLERSRVPASLRGLTFETAEERPGKREAIMALREWATLVSFGRSSASLVLHGLPGRGKTHLAIASVLACCEGGVRAEFWPLQSYLREMQQRFGAEGDSAQAFEERVARVDVLALDDVGAEQRSRSDWSTEVFERLIDARINAGRATLITTNLSPAALAQHVEARAADRLTMFRFIELGGESMRAEVARRGQ